MWKTNYLEKEVLRGNFIPSMYSLIAKTGKCRSKSFANSAIYKKAIRSVYSIKTRFFIPVNKVVPLMLAIIVITSASAQITEPQSPQFEQPKPVNVHQGSSAPSPHGQQVSHNNNRKQHQSALQPKKPNETGNKLNPDNIYQNINQNNYLLSSSASLPSKSNRSVELVHSIINEMNSYEPSIDYSFPSLQSSPGTDHFHKAFKELVAMLEGEKPLNLKRAVFITENAFFGNQMSYKDYTASIKEMALLIRLKMQQEGLPPTNEAINYMTHQYMSDTLDIRLPSKEQTATTYPKKYDFDDPFGYDHPGNMFVSKLIAENTGQCKSLPLLYLILINELGGKAYLSFSPSHSFVKVKGNNGVWHNIELTNGMLTSDSWIVGSGYVKAEAIKSGIFLDTLNKRQVIAHCLVDLAQYYSWRYEGYDDFVLKCVNKSMEYNPSDIWAIQVKSDYYSYLFEYVREQLGYTEVSQLKNNPKAAELFMQRNRIYALIDGLGYEPIPEKAYLDWLNTLEEKKQQQEHQKRYSNFSKFVR